MQLKLYKLLIIFLVIFSFITFGHAADYNYVKENQDNYVWRVNQLAWDESIVNKGKEVLINK